jgi:hypothetical protein
MYISYAFINLKKKKKKKNSIFHPYFIYFQPTL